MASLKCQLESLAATMQSYKQKHKHNYLFYSPHMRHEHFANWYTLHSSLLARHPLEYIHNCRISRKRKWTSGWQQVSQMCTKWKLALTFLQALCMDGRRWQRGRGEVRGRDGAAGALALALEVPKLCCVLLAKLLPGQLYHEKQKFAVKAKVNAASNSSNSNNTVGH